LLATVLEKRLLATVGSWPTQGRHPQDPRVCTSQLVSCPVQLL
jgi:hypothetical protein